ncbi:MAG: ROK family protein [Deltaproteobacteria bacterium]|nr:ROK family protein [Deltaproteobacteria bacterium]
MSTVEPKIEAVIGVDIGGTNIKIVFVDPRQGNVIDQVDLKTSAELGADAIVGELGTTLAAMMLKARGDGIQVGVLGVGCAGVIDIQRGSVLVSPNLPGWEGFPLQEKLIQILRIPVRVFNDVDCIGYAEYRLGGSELGNFLCIALGTGVGGSLILGGKVWRERGTSAGEIGHMTIQPDGERCLCGNRGCLETLASAGWLVRRAEERLRQGFASTLRDDLEGNGSLKAEYIQQAAQEGDGLAQELFNLVGTSLAIAIANVVQLLGIQSVVIAGGLANGWDFFIGPLQKELNQRLTMVRPPDFKVVRTELGHYAGALGAAYLATEAGEL